MTQMRIVLFQDGNQLEFVELPATHAYQLSALNLRLHKELSKLTADNVPQLPLVIAECDNLEFQHNQYTTISGLDYINRLEKTFAEIDEKSYPLIALLTEIRALQAQLEQWYEDAADGLM